MEERIEKKIIMEMVALKTEESTGRRRVSACPGDVKRRRRDPAAGPVNDDKSQRQQVDQSSAATTVKRSSRFRGVSRFEYKVSRLYSQKRKPLSVTKFGILRKYVDIDGLDGLKLTCGTSSLGMSHRRRKANKVQILHIPSVTISTLPFSIYMISPSLPLHFLTWNHLLCMSPGSFLRRVFHSLPG